MTEKQKLRTLNAAKKSLLGLGFKQESPGVFILILRTLHYRVQTPDAPRSAMGMGSWFFKAKDLDNPHDSLLSMNGCISVWAQATADRVVSIILEDILFKGRIQGINETRKEIQQFVKPLAEAIKNFSQV